MLLNPHVRRFELLPEPERPRVPLERMPEDNRVSAAWPIVSAVAVAMLMVLAFTLALLARGGR